MHINIVTVKSGWILQKIGERIATGNTDKDHTFTVKHEPDLSADVNFYVDLDNCYFGNKTKFDIGFLTHSDKDSEDYLKHIFTSKNVYDMDGITGMNQRYIDMAIRIGYPKNKTKLMIPIDAENTFSLKKTTLGIVSRGGYVGYGDLFLVELFSSYDLSGFKIKILGSGWQNVVDIGLELGIDIEYFPSEDYTFYEGFYHSLDYLLIPTLCTAGPMSFPEALSCGLPIISSEVGYVNYEFQADYVYPPGNTQKLFKILQKIRLPIEERRNQIKGFNWENYREELVEFIKELQ